MYLFDGDNNAKSLHKNHLNNMNLYIHLYHPNIRNLFFQEGVDNVKLHQFVQIFLMLYLFYSMNEWILIYLHLKDIFLEEVHMNYYNLKLLKMEIWDIYLVDYIEFPNK